MNTFHKKEIKDYSDDDLFSLVRNPKQIDKKRLSDIIDELRERGHSDKVDKMEKDLIKLNPIYSKFWLRIGAYILDVFILGVFGFILGLFLGDNFVQMGAQSMLVGFLITLLYFGLGNSNIFNGQTIGKRAVKLQVVDSNFKTLSVQKSILRSLVYTVPYFFLNYKLAGWSEFSILFMAKGILFLIFLIILPIHLILNTPTRQAIHDLIIGTYVVSLERYPRQELTKSRSLPLYITAILSLVIFGIIIFNNSRNNYTTSLVNELKPLKDKIDNIDKVRYSSISRNSSSMKKLGSDDYINKSESLRLTIALKSNLISKVSPNNIENLEFVKKAVKIILNDYSSINDLDYIQVNLVYGYSIGIHKSSKSIGFTNTVKYWKDAVD